MTNKPKEPGSMTNEPVVNEEEVTLAPEGTPMAEFQKERTDALSEMFDSGPDACGIYRTSRLFARLDRCVAGLLERSRASRTGDRREFRVYDVATAISRACAPEGERLDEDLIAAHIDVELDRVFRLRASTPSPAQPNVEPLWGWKCERHGYGGGGYESAAEAAGDAFPNHGMPSCDVRVYPIPKPSIESSAQSDPSSSPYESLDVCEGVAGDDLAALRACAYAWVPEARLLGNVRALTIRRLCDELIARRGAEATSSIDYMQRVGRAYFDPPREDDAVPEKPEPK